MGVAGGPNIERDGLVFGYDTGANPSSNFDHNSEQRRYFKGQPATNIITGNIPTYFGSSGEALYQNKYLGFTSLSGVFQRNYVTNPATSDIAAFNNNAGLTRGSLSISNLSASTTYLQISFDFYLITPYIRINNTTGLGGYMYVQYTDDSFGTHFWNTTYSNGSNTEWSSNSAYVGKWQKVSLIAGLDSQKTPSNINTFYIYMDRATQGEGIFTNFIITEHSSFPTGPVLYTSSSRSSTESLIDLTKSTNIDVSNVSFDSDGLPTFDGTDDYISLGDDSRFDFTNGIFTVEAIIKFPSSWTAGDQFPNLISKGATAGWDTAGWSLFGFRNYGSGTGYAVGIGLRNGGTANIRPVYNLPTETWIHVVGTLDGSTIRLYINGTENSTLTQTINPASNSTEVLIGKDANNQHFPGEIPITKIYNRALSAQEVQQNYKAYKNRFNI